ncbi:MAG: glyoxylase-like metal-dependent hydrolase (beta-lactamase superfamily II) [Gammaproteobacteria bacterium]|jgi:glyoxylase-like metal-dependent hydrolase (beta-lactamase superfamily II)
MTTRALGNLTLMRALELMTPFDPAVFFPETPAEAWEPYKHWLQPNALDPDTGMLKLYMQSYIVRTSHHTILIDTCVGNHKERANRPAWHLKSDNAYMSALAAHRLTPADIDFVMCTHLHGDHVGWNTQLINGQWVPTFPNARYIFSEKELNAWQSGADARFPDQPLVDSVLPVIAAGQAQLVSNDFALDDEVWLEPTPGHTPDHVAIRLASKGESAVMSGDLMHCPVQCKHPEWTAWPDYDAGQAKQTRRAFLERYCETETLVCTAHFPLPSAGRIIRDGDAFGFAYDDNTW